MEKLLIVAISPIVIILLYIYIKDKYEKEPKSFALIGTLYGMLIAIPIIFTEKYMMKISPEQNTIQYIFFVSFIVAGSIEETYKYIVLKILIWRNKNFNEPFDGILYAVFVSLGFAVVENIIYVLNPIIGGLHTGIARAIFSVPAHACFGVYMGYNLSKERFPTRKTSLMALIITIFIHGLYDMLLFAYIPHSNIFFVIFFIYIMVSSFIMIKKYIKISPFKNTKKH